MTSTESLIPGVPAPNIGRAGKTAQDTTVAIFAQGSALLTSLIGFVYPIMAARHPSSAGSQQGPADYGAATASLCDSDEGRELVKTLGNFIERIIEVRDPEMYTTGAVIKRNRDDGRAAGQVNSDSDMSIRSSEEPLWSPESPVSDEQLRSFSAVNEKVHEHVFNKMPIRMLVFDSKGTNVELVERKAVAARITSRIKHKYPNGIRPSEIEETAKEFAKYAILSHTWIRDTPGDIVYQDWETRQFQSHSAGHAKIINFCKAAVVEHGMGFGWMDTVCINKDSSSELDESIRSMYKWYQGAHVCVAYLADTSTIESMHDDSWFTRGWTLQELLAPKAIRFYNRDWQPLLSPPSFTVDDPTFNRYHNPLLYLAVDLPLEIQYQIFKATTITRHELHQFHDDSHSVSLSRIMQLAAHRKVTREEDSIYSLMGLLGVGIPIAYGEGPSSALRRIFREIMVSKQYFMDLFQHHNKQTILPQHISDYLNHDTSALNSLDIFQPKDPLVLTHRGVRLTLLALPAFRRDKYEKLIPSRSKACIFNVYCFGTEDVDYILLDNSEYSAKWTTALVTRPWDPQESYPSVIFMAMLSSVVHSRHAMFSPTTGLCVLMHSEEIRQHNEQKLLDIMPSHQMSGPMTIPLPYTPGHASRHIFLDEAKRLGMKVITNDFL